jgi:hypothetical protein
VSLPHWNLYRLFQAIAPLEDGIALCGRRGRWLKISLSSDDSLRIGEISADENEFHKKSIFAPLPDCAIPGLSLQVAQWDGESKAFLDSRGLLHLKPGDPSAPEISLVLSRGEIAGWTSDGFTCGPAFFFEDLIQPQPARVFERLQRFVKGL